jgi:hypothetical protein
MEKKSRSKNHKRKMFIMFAVVFQHPFCFFFKFQNTLSIKLDNFHDVSLSVSLSATEPQTTVNKCATHGL